MMIERPVRLPPNRTPGDPRQTRMAAQEANTRNDQRPRRRHADEAEGQETVDVPVLLLNDDYTPMEFVVLVSSISSYKFRKEATRIMLHVTDYGVGVCGVFPPSRRNTKSAQVMDLAREQQHPLQRTQGTRGPETRMPSSTPKP